MSKNIFFSIIIPTYNRADFLIHSIESVIKQSYNNWELIIIDDGSTDNTSDLIKKYKKKEKRITYIYQDNSERSAARNNGILRANGEWVCFLDSDDKYMPNHLLIFNKLITSVGFQKALYFCGLKNNISETFQNRLNYNNIEFVMLNSISTPQACVNREVLMKNLFDESLKVGEDRDLWVRILTNYDLYYHSTQTLIQTEHKNRSVNKGSEYENLKSILITLKHAKKNVRKKVKLNILSKAYFKITKREIKNENRIKSIYFIILSLLYSRKDPQFIHKLLVFASLVFRRKNKIIQEYESS